MQEIWKIISDWPNYLISNLGRVKPIHPRYKRNESGMSISVSGPGYAVVHLVRNGKDKNTVSVHGLVARAFIGVRQKGFCVNHKDGNKMNPTLENLEYVTYSENNNHAIRIGLVKLKQKPPCIECGKPFYCKQRCTLHYQRYHTLALAESKKGKK